MSTRAFYETFDLNEEGTTNFINAIINYDPSKNVITPIKNADASKEQTKKLVKKIRERFGDKGEK